MQRISALLLILLLTTTLAWALPVPINGDFESADMYSADQWSIDGPWRFRGNNNHDGRRSAGIRDYEVLSGDRLTSNSGVVVRDNEITLTGFYKGHGFIAGIEIVDLLGNVVDSAHTDVLEATEEYAQFTVTWEPSAELINGTMLWARAFVEAVAEAEGVVDGIAFDEMHLTPPPPPAPVVKKPVEEDEEAEEVVEEIPIPAPCPNIAPAIRASGLFANGGWTASDAGTQTAIETGGFNRPACLLLTGGPQAASWTANLDRLDISVPYQVSFDVTMKDAETDAAIHAAIVIFDNYLEKVYYAAAIPVASDQHTISLMIPELEKLPTSARGQLSLIAPANFEGQVRFSDVAVVADPHVPTIKAARQKIAVFPNTKSVSFFAQVPNKIDQVTEMVTHIKTINRDGKPIGYEKRRMGVAPRAVALFPASPRPKYNDAYTLIVRVQAVDGSRTFAYGEYPFVLSPAQPEDPKNYDFGVALHGLAEEDILAAATAGAGWITAPVVYTADANSRELAVRMRDLKKVARQAEKYGVKLAVQITVPAGTQLTSEDFADFFGKVDWRLGELASAYIVGLTEETYVAADAAATIETITETVNRIQAEETADSAILLPAGTLKWLEDAKAAQTASTNDDAAAIAQPTAPTLGTTFEIAYQGNLDSDAEWLVPMMIADNVDVDANIAREAAIALSGNAGVVIIPNAGDAALLNEAYAATPNWASFWTLCNQLRGKQFAGGAVVDNMQWLRFNGPDGDTVVAWALAGEQPVVLSGAIDDAVKVTMGGQEWPVNTTMGRSKTTLTDKPLYINVTPGANFMIKAVAGETDNQ